MKAQDIARLVQDVYDTEAAYLLHGPRHDPVVTPWMPYQPADFIAILWECMPHITKMKPVVIPSPVTGQPRELWEMPNFLDVGCGPGTKMRIAEGVFGFNVRGVEIDTEMARIARHFYGDFVQEGDALSLPPSYYQDEDLIWLYRPFRDQDKELALEKLITEQMKPGAILAGGSWETDLSALGWETIVDDTLTNPNGPGCIWRCAWRKPRSQ